jgi:WD40-like Beta Propeller Repeat
MREHESGREGDYPSLQREHRPPGRFRGLVLVLLLIGTGFVAWQASEDSELGVAAAIGHDHGAAVELPESGVESLDITASTSSPSTPTTLAAITTTAPAESAPEPALLYARRHVARVTVYRQRPSGGEPEALFAYDDAGAELPDDPSSPASPDLALSPDRRSVAFVAREGLRVRDLRSGKERSVIARREQATADGTRVFWSIPKMNPTEPDPYHQSGIFSIGDPRWSADGRSLAFSQGAYEFQGHGIVDLQSGRYVTDRGSERLAWSPVEARAAATGTSYAHEGYLHMSERDDLGEWEDLGRRIGGPAERSYEAAVFDPSGRQLAVTFADEPFGTPRHLAVVKVDGSGFREVDGEGAKGGMAFSPDGSALVFTERRGGTSVLVRHDLRTGKAADLFTLPDPYYSWTDLEFTSAGDLAMVGRTRVPWEPEEH